MRHMMVRATFLLLVVASGISIAWFIFDPDFEPALTSLALVAAITGLFIDRWVAAKERRKELLHALAHELNMNLQVLGDPLFKPDAEVRERPCVYPRLHTTTLQTAIGSGAFIQTRDRSLFKLMHSWQERASDFNRRLDVTELRTFTNPRPEEIAAFRRALTGARVLAETQRLLHDLSKLLQDDYAKESGIARNTTLFADPNQDSTA